MIYADLQVAIEMAQIWSGVEEIVNLNSFRFSPQNNNIGIIPSILFISLNYPLKQLFFKLYAVLKMEDGTIIQIAFIAIFFAISFACGLLPYKCKSLRKDTAWSCLANCFSGGIFLSISLIHMLPISVQAFEEGWDGQCEYNWAFFIALLGYSLILFIERVAVNPGGF